MKKNYILWIILLSFVFVVSAGGLMVYFAGDMVSVSRTESKSAETEIVERDTIDEFASEISDLVREYDGRIVDTDALSDPWYSRRLIVQGTGTNLDLSSYGAKVVVHGPYDMHVMQFTTREEAETVCEKLQDNEGVEYCEPDRYAEGAETDGKYEAMSWGVDQIGADVFAGYLKGVTDKKITVAVVDSGVYEHSFLKGRMLSDGIDYVDNDGRPEDKNSHGTHVAGTIVDCTPGLNVMILPVRVLGANNTGSSLIISLGIRYAVSHGAQVMNLSLGSIGGTCRTIDDAVTYAVHRGCIVVAAAGNHKSDTANVSPAHLQECIVVSAVDEKMKKADFSEWGTNWGESVDFAAPGVDIVSCVPSLVMGYTVGEGQMRKSGTSMATPHIAALAAMIKLENPSMTSDEVQNVMKEHCVDLGDAGKDPYYGWGLPVFFEKADDRKSEESLSDVTDADADRKAEDMDQSGAISENTVQSDPMDCYEDILAEYKMLAEHNFDYSLRDQIRYANEGVWNFSGQDKYSVYYRLADLAGDGEPELLISVNENEAPKSIVDIFGIKNGKPIAVLESDASVGYRSRYFITTSNKIKNESSSGALNTQISYYSLPKNSVFMELEEQYIYDGWDGDQYTYIDSDNNSNTISKEEWMYYYSGEDVDFESGWELLF